MNKTILDYDNTLHVIQKMRKIKLPDSVINQVLRKLYKRAGSHWFASSRTWYECKMKNEK